jgi:hypothetical protein
MATVEVDIADTTVSVSDINSLANCSDVALGWPIRLVKDLIHNYLEEHAHK